MILEIALGIVLAVIIIALLPYILALAGILLALALVLGALALFIIFVWPLIVAYPVIAGLIALTVYGIYYAVSEHDAI